MAGKHIANKNEHTQHSLRTNSSRNFGSALLDFLSQIKTVGGKALIKTLHTTSRTMLSVPVLNNCPLVPILDSLEGKAGTVPRLVLHAGRICDRKQRMNYEQQTFESSSFQNMRARYSSRHLLATRDERL